jgi:hypothetical protein
MGAFSIRSMSDTIFAMGFSETACGPPPIALSESLL